MLRKIWNVIRHSPLPFFALIGLCVGIFLYFFVRRTDWAEIVWFATLILGGLPIVYKTAKGMLKGQFASDIVAMLAIITAILLDQAFAGAIVVLMQSGGEAIEAYGLRRATSSLTALLKRAPTIAHRKMDGSLEDINVDEVKIGDLLIIRPGDLVPVDGTVIDGIAEIDESAITGEPLTRSKKTSDRLLSGSISVNGIIEMRADRRSSESQYAKIVHLVQTAQEQKAPIQRLADRYAIYFTPLALFMAGLGFLITGRLDTILSVLVVATPCPLILATPLAVICAINRAADIGIIVKGGAPIEQAASAQAVVFDKTGTITFGTPFVEQAVSLNGEKESDVLYHAAIIDQFSSHSIAKAIVAKAQETFKNLPLPENFKEIPGQGAEGSFQGHSYLVGSHALLENKLGKTCFGADESLVERYYRENKLLSFIARDGVCIGFLVITDKIRPNVPEMIGHLRSLGIKEIAMLTGDSKKNAEIIARQAGIRSFKSQLLPEQKVDSVRELLTKYNPVIMVGDGINDAPALATATVGIAMGAYGTAISAEAADIIFLVDDLGRVADTVEIGQRMLYIAKQSILIGIGLSFCLMVIAAAGFIMPAIGALLQEIIDVAVILNALRAR